MQALVATCAACARRFPTWTRWSPEKLTLRAFVEEVFATHRAGFKSVADYHAQCSSINYISAIKSADPNPLRGRRPGGRRRGDREDPHAEGTRRDPDPTRRSRGLLLGWGNHLGTRCGGPTKSWPVGSKT